MTENTLISALSNLTHTENGALAYSSTLNPLLDLFSKQGGMRGYDSSSVTSILSAARSSDVTLFARNMFYLRDIRGGLGERQTFRHILAWYAKNHPEELVPLLHHVPEYGRWDDLIWLISNNDSVPVIEEIFNLIRAQIKLDKAKMKDSESISLLAKWLPSENASSKVTQTNARIVRSFLGLYPKQYRKMLSEMRAYIDVTERKMCAKQWDLIDYSAVPSRAMLKYGKAFKKQDFNRFSQFLYKVQTGEAKINSGTLYPSDIVHSWQTGQGDEQTWTAQWEALPDYCDGRNAIVVADVSASMNGQPLEVSIGLALYFAERNKGPFHNCFITFSSEPEFVKLDSNQSIAEKLKTISRANWTQSTDILAMFRLILNRAVQNNVPQEHMPESMYIISDMQFNSCDRSFNRTTFEIIEQEYRDAGYVRPSLIFWNVRASSGQPVKEDTTGTALVSGYSPSVFQAAMSRNMNPGDMMLQILNSERYSPIVVG